MKAEIITIGEEILSGQTVDTNSAYIAQRLAEIGIEVALKTTVGDRTDDITEAIRSAWQRSEVTIVTGGLGPTEDDITKKAICNAFERKLVFHEEIVHELEQRFAARQVKMPPLTQNQGLQPQGAELLPNPIGSAVGIVFRDQQRYFVALPGVPTEMEILLNEGVLPQLRRMPRCDYIEARRIRTVGIMEGDLAEMIGDLAPSGEGLRLAYLPSYRAVDLRVTGMFPTEVEAKQQVEELTQAIAERIAPHVFTVGEKSMAEVVATLLASKRRTIATAESCTGGLLAKQLTDIAGSSDWYLGSVVAYANEVKQKILKVPERLLVEHGAVSAEVARAMATNARELTGADFALSTTGIAGPSGGTEEKPVGLVYIGLATPEQCDATRFNLAGTRQRVRERTCLLALDLLRRKLLGERP
jgi:nicotinamide-nucleotide amidase